MKSRNGLLLCALLFGATLVAYLPALKAGFIWNDSDYVTAPALRSADGLRRIWFEVGATEQYYPLLHSAFWLEHRLWGDEAMGYHLLNILLHATSACLLYAVLRRLLVERVVPSALLGPGDRTSGLGTTRSTFFNVPVLAAFLFALHPVYVESVAWISEQKNTLSTVFYLLAMLAFLTWHPDRVGVVPMRKTPTLWGRYVGLEWRGLGWYVLAFALFVLALLTKTVAATLPGALLVIVWWQRGRLSWKRDVLPLIPWFVVGAASGLFSAWVERTYVGAQGADFGLNALQRCLLAGRAVWFYLGKLIWPADLIFIYPRWEVSGAVLSQYLWPLGVVAAVAALWLMRKRTRGPLAAMLFFLGSLFPVSGLFNLYAFIYSYVADHWQYLPSIGIMVLAAAGWEKWDNGGVGKGASRQVRAHLFRLPRIVAAIVLAILGVLTYRQSGMYNDIETFYRRTIAKNPDCWMAHTNLGLILAASGRPQEAITHYEQALQFAPYSPEVIHNDLGRVLLDTGRTPEAIAQFEEALQLDGDYSRAHFNLGDAFLRERRLPEAIAQFDAALRIDTHDSMTHNDQGIALAEAGRSAEAISQFEEAARLNPNNAEARNNLGSVFAGQKRFPEAMEQYQEASRIDPRYADPHFNLGLALLRQRRWPEARAEFEQALRLRPDYPAARDKLLELQTLESEANSP